jgi:dimethylhistidine N-methyltransferase
VRKEVVAGLSSSPKELPCKLFYDERGSQLFEKITQLEEYYLTRTEISIMEACVSEMASLAGPGCMLIEYGSGSSLKTRILLDHLNYPAAYVPIDISRDHLMRSAAAIAATYPDMEVLPICADYSGAIRIPAGANPVSRRIVYFPGSTIGNFHPREAVEFMRKIARICEPGGGLIIGVDLKKNPDTLLRAYNDREGVTAEFNLNILVRLNRVLEMDFQTERFNHVAVYDPTAGRIEMHLISMEDQVVRLDDLEFPFAKGESIWTESSYKFTSEEFSRIASSSGFVVDKVWTDEENLFSVQYLTVANDTM